MSSVVIAGDTSGSITLEAPAVAGTTTLTLPTTNGTVIVGSGGVTGVASGGTGRSSQTAFAVICGGTTTTSAQQSIASVGTAGQVLTSNGAGALPTFQEAAGFPAGTVLIFGQTAAPTGWTKDTTNFNNSSLRVVTGTASSGGTVDFTTAFASQTPTGSVTITSVTGTAGATTLTTPQIPSHAHNVLATGFTSPVSNITMFGTFSRQSSQGVASGSFGTSNGNTGTDNTGGGGSHDHPFSFSSGSGTFSGNAINLAVKYVDVIRATKN